MRFLKSIARGLGSAVGLGSKPPRYEMRANPHEMAAPNIAAAGQTLREHYYPYIDRGTEATRVSSPVYQKLAQNPRGYLEEMMADYQPSRGFNFKRQELLKAAANSAAAAGTGGSYADKMENTRLVDNLLEDDINSYLDRILSLQGRGLEGLNNTARTGERFSQLFAQGDAQNRMDLADNASSAQYFQNDELDRATQARNARREWNDRAIGTGIKAAVGAGAGAFPVEAGADFGWRNVLGGANEVLQGQVPTFRGADGKPTTQNPQYFNGQPPMQPMQRPGYGSYDNYGYQDYPDSYSNQYLRQIANPSYGNYNADRWLDQIASQGGTRFQRRGSEGY